MAEPRVFVLRAAGINCDAETAFAFEQAGARVEALHINRLLESPPLLEDAGLLAIPGGFSYGDDIAAGKVLALEVGHRLGEHLRRFIARGGLVLGICNGFQVLARSGLLTLGENASARADQLTLSWNDSHRYEDRWVTLSVDPALCVMAPRDRASLRLPVAHGEGKVVLSPPALERALASHQAVFRYTNEDGSEPEYPANPNGSVGHIAGLCDPTGQVLGLMPHPERALFPWNHPSWTREPPRSEGDGACLFRAAVLAMR